MGQRVRWGPELILAQKGLPLAPLIEVKMVEENGTVQVQKKGGMAEDDAIAE